ncbi:MAG TPA: LDL receptor domain-containing protein [Polyangiaceae bacterium]|nr:LDL receptor domain-containing protein [Polyangiaceae bacterium]
MQHRIQTSWGRWALAAATLMLGAGVACGGDSDEPDDVVTRACTSFGQRVAECGLLSDGPLDCSGPTTGFSPGSAEELECELDCFLNAECGVLEGLLCEGDFAPGVETASVLTCFFACTEQFGFHCAEAGGGATSVPSLSVCDGFRDCNDGSDENGCQLFACGDGQSVATRVVCDGYFDCTDGQDEDQNCPVFRCADGFEVPGPFQCDGEADCLDGSDEAGCPAQATLTCGG